MNEAASLFNVKVFTLFPEVFPGVLGSSIVGKALEKNLWSLAAINLRDYAYDKHKQVDDIAYGGGPGMVMRPDVIDAALTHHYTQAGPQECSLTRPETLIYLSPKGTPLTQAKAQQLARCQNIGLLCGRFEGVDQRVLEHWNFEEISIGDYVLSNGELAAQVLIDACVRLIPGVLGAPESLAEESFSHGLLEYPQYTRPREWKDCIVPEVLLSGNHQKIESWRKEQAKSITMARRPDLWEDYVKRNNLSE
jgi:tRNA (guanine37-N1)-methyltransferase